ncbi:hypothetical protein V7S43_000482 [Phytophthora oleae]|uniref:Methyltransferase domain-containing protein n=1 Tax=Phytophthora oleae TaxID=2107226 RepID=A0ABD3G7V2_9STRA
MVSVTWEECGCILKQLQAAAHVVRSNLGEPSRTESKRVLKTLLPKILSCLQVFRQTINVVFLQNDDETSNQDTLIQEQLERSAGLLAATQMCTRCKIPTIGSIQQEREEKTQDELAAVSQVNKVLSRHNQPGISAADQERLKALVIRRRQQEQQLAFHRGLFKAQQEFSGDGSNYSAENFSYGSTPFSTWLNLFTQKSVLDAVSRSRKQTLTVFGSSSGSLVLFAALTLGLRSVGVEILPFLHDVAERTRQELQIPKDKCCFVCADMLTVSLQETSILLLTSQCWDAGLYQQIQQQLEGELQSGALVLDYKAALQNSPHFQLLQELPNQRVSWNSAQSLFIFIRT